MQAIEIIKAEGKVTNAKAISRGLSAKRAKMPPGPERNATSLLIEQMDTCASGECNMAEMPALIAHTMKRLNATG